MMEERRARMEELANDVVREAGVEHHENIRTDLRSSISKIKFALGERNSTGNAHI
jgi:hypothetical protein